MSAQGFRLAGVTYDEWLAKILAHFPVKRDVAERRAKVLSTSPQPVTMPRRPPDYMLPEDPFPGHPFRDDECE